MALIGNLRLIGWAVAIRPWPAAAKLPHAKSARDAAHTYITPDNRAFARYRTPPGPVRAFGIEERMSGTARSSEGLDVRRRKLLFRAWHRGLREVDLILGGFADGNVETLNDAELSEFETLMNVPDGELLAWLTGEADVPASHDGPVFRRLRGFRAGQKGA
jgi:antitoxin CptB